MNKLGELEITDFIGKTFNGIDVTDDEILFECEDGKRYKMFHSQDCCESVTIEDITGDIKDLIGSEIIVAEERTSDKNPEGITKEYQDSFTWTFYTFRTMKGSVDIRWYGDSNGYYSESVDLMEVE